MEAAARWELKKVTEFSSSFWQMRLLCIRSEHVRRPMWFSPQLCKICFKVGCAAEKPQNICLHRQVRWEPVTVDPGV